MVDVQILWSFNHDSHANFTLAYGWWFNTEDKEFVATIPSNKSVGFQESVAAIEQKFAESGPFDGILGFSQGATFTTILCAMQQMKSNYLSILSPTKWT